MNFSDSQTVCSHLQSVICFQSLTSQTSVSKCKAVEQYGILLYVLVGGHVTVCEVSEDKSQEAAATLSEPVLAASSWAIRLCEMWWQAPVIPARQR